MFLITTTPPYITYLITGVVTNVFGHRTLLP